MDNFYYVVLTSPASSSSGFMLYVNTGASTVEKSRTTQKSCLCNTGKEREETLEFLYKNARKTGTYPSLGWSTTSNPNARGGREDPKSGYKVVDFTNGFKAVESLTRRLKEADTVPNPVNEEYCTAR